MTGTSPEAYRNDLAKGLGRVLQGARTLGAAIDEDAVLQACLYCQAYDSQSENSRGPWLVQILEVAGLFERFREPILEALQSDGDEDDLYQRWDIALAHAQRGWEPARKALYQTFESRHERHSCWDAMDQILRLDGLDGLRYIAERHGKNLLAGKNIRPVDSVVGEAGWVLGKQPVADFLKRESHTSNALRAFVENYEAEMERLKGIAHHGPRVTQAQAMAKIESQGDKRLLWLYPWAKRAADLDLAPVLRAAKNEPDDRKLANYLRIIAPKRLEPFDTWLVELTDHQDSDVRTTAYRALAQNRHRLIRALAIRRIREGHNDGPTIELLIRNYEDGDHRLLERGLTYDHDRDDLHATVWAMEKVFSENSTPDAGACLLFGYEATPCGACRARIVGLLLKLGIAPVELIDECRVDANDEVRGHVAGLT